MFENNVKILACGDPSGIYNKNLPHSMMLACRTQASHHHKSLVRVIMFTAQGLTRGSMDMLPSLDVPPKLPLHRLDGTGVPLPPQYTTFLVFIALFSWQLRSEMRSEIHIVKENEKKRDRKEYFMIILYVMTSAKPRFIFYMNAYWP